MSGASGETPGGEPPGVPGQVFPVDGTITLNEGAPRTTLRVVPGLTLPAPGALDDSPETAGAAGPEA